MEQMNQKSRVFGERRRRLTEMGAAAGRETQWESFASVVSDDCAHCDVTGKILDTMHMLP